MTFRRRRCRARLDRDTSPVHYGRCVLDRGHADPEHALERVGNTVVRWSIYRRWGSP